MPTCRQHPLSHLPVALLLHTWKLRNQSNMINLPANTDYIEQQNSSLRRTVGGYRRHRAPVPASPTWSRYQYAAILFESTGVSPFMVVGALQRVQELSERQKEASRTAPQTIVVTSISNQTSEVSLTDIHVVPADCWQTVTQIQDQRMRQCTLRAGERRRFPARAFAPHEELKL